jgi:hypothetical protein
MKNLSTLLFTLLFATLASTQVIQSIPGSAYMVFSADLGRVTKSMSVHEMDDYDFIQQLVREFSGSNKEEVSLKDLGVNYKGKVAVYTGSEEAFSYVGVAIDIKDKATFLSNEVVRKEFSSDLKSKGYSETDRSIGFLNKKTFTRVDLDWENSYFRNITDSIFDANKWERPYSYYYDDYGYEEMPAEVIEVEVESEEALEEAGTEEGQEESMEEKYERILDSVKTVEKNKFKKEFYQGIIKGKGLIESNEDFEKTMAVAADGSIYLNPSMMNRYEGNKFGYNPYMRGMRQFSNNIWQSAHMNMTKEGMNVEWFTHGDEKVMKVTKAGLTGDFNDELIKYVPAYSQGVAAYNLNMLGAYEAVKETYMPVLDQSEKPEYLLASAIWSTIDEVVDESAVSDIYGANMLLSYNGMKEMTLTKTSYDYDEETFEYEEREEQYQDLVPIMTWAISTDKAYLLGKFMKAATAYADEEIVKHENYYEIKKGPMGGTPFYVAIKKEVILVTNEKSLVQDHIDGYDKGVDKEIAKAIKETRFVYANMDMQQMPDDLLSFTTSKGDRDFIEAMKDKTGSLEFKMAEVTDDYQKVTATFRYSKNYKNGMFYLMDIIDTLMSQGDERMKN